VADTACGQPDGDLAVTRRLNVDLLDRDRRAPLARYDRFGSLTH
jgi:hypothetical protein